MTERYFFTYIDITNDQRPFYVGKGDVHRVQQLERGRLWQRIAKAHGHSRRLIVFETLNEQWALDREVELIAQLKTNMLRSSEGHWGANLTDGGEGTTGFKHSEEAKQKIREALSKRIITSETRTKIGDLHRGKLHSEESRQKISQTLTGKKYPNRTVSEAVRRACGKAFLGRRHVCKTCGEVGHYRCKIRP